MTKFYIALIILPIFLANVCRVNSIECYQCESVNGGYKECDQGYRTNVTRGPCKADEKGRDAYCFKMVGKGARSKNDTVLRGCYIDHVTSRNYSQDEDPFYHSAQSGEYKVWGTLYTCDTDLCNSANDFTYSLMLLISLSGASLFYKSRFSFA